MNVWKVEKCTIMSVAFAATSSLLPEGRIVYLNDKCELVYLEKKLDKKTNKNKGAFPFIFIFIFIFIDIFIFIYI
jgi:hypothetical protein